MIKKTIKYDDLDGNPMESDFYFNMTKAEIVELEVMKPGGLHGYMQDLIDAEDNREILAIFKEMIQMSVGQRSADGVSFDKTPDFTRRFMNTNAYSELVMELFRDEQFAADFMVGLVPIGMQQSIREEFNKKDEKKTTTLQLPESDTAEGEALLALDRDLTGSEFASLTADQQRQAFNMKMARDAAKPSTQE